MSNEQKINELLNRVGRFKTEHNLDLSSGEDLSIAIMNLVSLEEHFFFSGAKTGRENYFDLLAKVREMRKELLGQIVKNPNGEEWCISKHLLAASMRLIEVGTKYFGEDKKKEARDLFAKAYDLYSLFWGINLKTIDIGEMKSIPEGALNNKDKGDDSVMKGLNELVEKLVDCCKE